MISPSRFSISRWCLLSGHRTDWARLYEPAYCKASGSKYGDAVTAFFSAKRPPRGLARRAALSRLLEVPTLSNLLPERDGERRAHWLRVFALMFGRASFVEVGDDHRTFHLLALDEGRLWEERVARSLSDLVFRQLFPDLVTALDAADPGQHVPRPSDMFLVVQPRNRVLCPQNTAKDRILWEVSMPLLTPEAAHPEWWTWAFWCRDPQGIRDLVFTVGAIVGIPFLVWREWLNHRQTRAALGQAGTAQDRHKAQVDADRERRITDNFTRAVEHLGHDKLETRLGAIYALERIARERSN